MAILITLLFIIASVIVVIVFEYQSTKAARALYARKVKDLNIETTNKIKELERFNKLYEEWYKELNKINKS